MDNPPYLGQGEALPPDVADGEGDWIIKGKFFLWIPSNPMFRKTRGYIAPNPAGFHFVGFHLEVLAEAFSISAADLRSINREQKLEISLIPGEIVGASSDAVATYLITLPDGSQVAAPVRSASIEGSA
jgi:hypothetical protein